MESLDTLKLRLIGQIDYLNNELEQLRYKEPTLLQAYIYNSIDTTDIVCPIIIGDKN